MTTARWTQQLARWLARPGATTAVLESHLDELLLWLSNPENPRAADLDRAIARVGLTRSEAAARAYARLDQWLFDPDQGSPARTLGLTEDADPARVKQRYRRLIQVYHPDRHADRTAWATQRTERINRASDTHRRSAAAAAASTEQPSTHAETTSSGVEQATRRHPLEQLVARATASAGRIRRWFAGQTAARRWTTLALLATCGLTILVAVSTEERPRRHPAVRPSGVPSIQSLPSLGRSAPAPRVAEASQAAPVVTPSPTPPDPDVSTLAPDGSATAETEQPPAVEPGPTPRPTPAPSAELPATTGQEPATPPPIAQTQGPALADEGTSAPPASQAVEPRAAEPPPTAATPATTPPPDGALTVAPPLTIPPASPPTRPSAPSPPIPPSRLAQGPVATPVVPGLGAATIDCRPVAERLGSFQQAYEAGALDRLMALYSPLARENALATWFAIRQTYADWFAKTALRRIVFDQLQVKATANGERCAAIAAFRVEYLDSRSSLMTKEGVIQILFERRGPDLLILRARY